MKLLLDTHVVLWLLSEPDRLRAEALEAASAAQNELRVSAVSVWEMAIKQSLGKLDLPGPVETWLPDALDDAGMRGCDVTVADAARVRALPWHHRDPFDRLLVAQALGGFVLVTHDRRLKAYDVPILPA